MAKTFDQCPDCRNTLETESPGVWAHPHDCSNEAKCEGCGTVGCSARELHESVARSVGVRPHNERVEILKAHGIQLPAWWGRDEEGDRFVEQIANALEQLKAQVHGLPQRPAPQRKCGNCGAASGNMALCDWCGGRSPLQHPEPCAACGGEGGHASAVTGQRLICAACGGSGNKP